MKRLYVLLCATIIGILIPENTPVSVDEITTLLDSRPINLRNLFQNFLLSGVFAGFGAKICDTVGKVTSSSPPPVSTPPSKSTTPAATTPSYGSPSPSSTKSPPSQSNGSPPSTTPANPPSSFPSSNYTVPIVRRNVTLPVPAVSPVTKA